MKLVNRILENQERKKVLDEIDELPSVSIADEMILDAELIANGGYSPIDGFLTQNDFQSVLDKMHLSDGSPWTIPIVLPVNEDAINEISEGDDVVLKSSEDEEIAILHLEEIYGFDKKEFASKVFGTTDSDHPGVGWTFYDWGDTLLAGKVDLLTRPKRPFEKYHIDPEETRKEFQKRRWETIVGFQTRNPVHRSHEYIQKCALEIVDGLLLHPITITRKGDVPAKIRMKTYQLMLNKYYPRNRVLLSTLPTAMRYAGPREAVFHALIRRNFGCTHFIVGRDHAGVGDYYGPYDAQRIFNEFNEGELGVTPLFFENAFYCRKCDSMATKKTCPHLKSNRVAPSGTKVRRILLEDENLSKKIMRPEVAELLREYYQKINDKGKSD
ncbi:sulfate adenylyltransferase [candidate division MSBL1 archaeon SCGC-AAA261F19]|uniref:Sulfate adenylyltransferase n=1 Tax=candidate division MSBL1 archaeon SCGC-AAA261F19 TaxID=1698275 RepID=A0A133V9F7_9EURY|nr:sulfate adenylyltransferase [candidate division MSBL1 archaeon SCGC-AAA261F19]